MMCAGIVAACNASDTERPVVENPALAPAGGTLSVDAPGDDAPGATGPRPDSFSRRGALNTPATRSAAVLGFFDRV
jgi:hypothetical protein